MRFIAVSFLFFLFFSVQSAEAGLGGSPYWASVPGHTFGGCCSGLPEWRFWKESSCGGGQVMVGTRSYQWTKDVDEEYEQAYCDSVTGLTLGSSFWVQAPNATTKIWGDYKTATCPAGYVMTGTRMYGIFSAVDEEHVDAYCSQIVSGAALGSPSWHSHRMPMPPYCEDSRKQFVHLDRSW